MNGGSNSKEAECDLTLFIACYNEEVGVVPTIETTVAAVQKVGCTYELVVVDDASKDDSVKLIREYMVQNPDVPIRLIVNESNQGLGANYSEAAFHGRGRYFRLICGDNAEDGESLVAALRHLGEADMILSYHSDSSGRRLSRRIISRLYTAIVNLLTGYRIKYYNGLAVHRRYDVMRWHSNAHGFGFQADLITRLLDYGATYIEVPIVPHDRLGGATKAFTFRNVVSVAHTLLDIFIRSTGRTLFPRDVNRLAHRPKVFDSPGFENLATDRPDKTGSGVQDPCDCR